MSTRIRNFFGRKYCSADTKIYASTRSVFESFTAVHTYPIVSGNFLICSSAQFFCRREYWNEHAHNCDLASFLPRHSYSRWSGDVIRRTGEKNFNAVSHNRAQPYFLFQRGRSEVISRRFPIECSFSNRKCGRHVMICWVLAMAILQGVWKQHLRPRAVVGYGVKIFLPSPPNYVTRSPGCKV